MRLLLLFPAFPALLLSGCQNLSEATRLLEEAKPASPDETARTEAFRQAAQKRIGGP